MEYSDNLISSAEDFAKMAKEYSSRLSREKHILNISSENEEYFITNISLILKNLIFLYNYIKKNIRSIRLKSAFLYMEEECLSDLKIIEDTFKLNKNKSKKTDKSKKRLNNFHSCVKLAISYEADLLNNLINLLNKSENVLKDISIKHLDFIKKLSNF